MPRLRAVLAILLAAALLLSGCSAARNQSKKQPPAPVVQQPPRHPELEEPLEKALLALRAMNETGKQRKFRESELHFREFRRHWAVIQPVLRVEDPKLEVHIEDGAVELDLEFAKPEDQIRVYELDEETVKIGRLLSKAAKLVGIPIKDELVQVDPTEDIPFNSTKKITIVMTDHKFAPNLIEIEQHTKVTFVLVNRGAVLHEFELGYYGLEVEDILPGKTEELTLVFLDAGEFEFACHVPGHYEVGMFGTIKVKPAQLKK